MLNLKFLSRLFNKSESALVKLEKLAKKEGTVLNFEGILGTGSSKYTYTSKSGTEFSHHIDPNGNLVKTIEKATNPQMERLGVSSIKVTDYVAKTSNTTLLHDAEQLPYKTDVFSQGLQSLAEKTESYKPFKGSCLNIAEDLGNSKHRSILNFFKHENGESITKINLRKNSSLYRKDMVIDGLKGHAVEGAYTTSNGKVHAFQGSSDGFPPGYINNPHSHKFNYSKFSSNMSII